MKRPHFLATLLVAATACALFANAGIGSENPAESKPSPEDVAPAEHSAALTLPWSSLNSGGALGVASASYELNYSLGQSVTGEAASPSYEMGIGFWYVTGGPGCPILITGDINVSGAITSADIILEVNFCFKGGAPPQPCVAAGDVNCSGTVTSADIIFLVNFVFKGGPAPCDGCTSPLAASC